MKDVDGFRIHLDPGSNSESDIEVRRINVKKIPKPSAPSGIYRYSAAPDESEYLVHAIGPDESLRSARDNDLAYEHTGFIDFSANRAFGGHQMPSTKPQWDGFFSSPQFYVVTATLIVLVSGAGMYSSLNTKIDQARLETKADAQFVDSRKDARFDKIDSRFSGLDARFDKVDARFDSLLSKMDADARETRELIRSSFSSK